jgi:hypothetical protein
MLSMRHAGQWLAVDDQPRVWFAMSELLSSPHAPSRPFREWTSEQTLACMVEAIERRSGLMEVTRACN